MRGLKHSDEHLDRCRHLHFVWTAIYIIKVQPATGIEPEFPAWWQIPCALQRSGIGVPVTFGLFHLPAEFFRVLKLVKSQK